MSQQPDTSISLLSIGSPPRTPPTSKPYTSRPSIPGRLHVSQPIGLSGFLDTQPVEHNEQFSSDEDITEHQFDTRRKKSKRTKRRIARPRDSMPGFGKRRYGTARRSRYSNFRFVTRGGGAVGGSRHLDRGINSAQYYGRGSIGSDSEEEHDQAASKRLGEIEAGLNGSSAGEYPVCLVHAQPCVTFVCKKPGKNKGREFFKCGKKQRYEQCDFFQWVDEPPKVFSDVENTDDDDAVSAVEVPAVFDVDGNEERSLKKVLRAYGHDQFRPGQAEALQLLLSGKSTLALLSTGGGKSLIYQMFAGVRPGVVVVVTPLVSLMLDQLSYLPEELPGACLRSGQTLEVIKTTEEKLRQGEIKVLFISPERLFSSRFRRLMSSRNSPKVSLVVLDEAHCISQWSHNFRTAYLRIPLTLFHNPASNISPVFREEPLILALTATATSTTIGGICESLKIDVKEGVIRCASKRDNLKLSLSRASAAVDAKASELVKLLKLDPFASILGFKEPEKLTIADSDVDSVDGNDATPKGAKKRRRTIDYKNDDDDGMIGWGSQRHATKRIRALKRARGKRQGSIIVYVTKQKDCASVSNYLKSAAFNIDGSIGMYHAGLSQKERKKVQNQFDRGSVAVLVATVAFGMGLNYSSVRGVIHFDMPSSLESYWQEIGRAGRDGRNSFCHILFSEHDGRKLLSRSHSDGVEKSTVRQFIRCIVDGAFEPSTISRKSHYTNARSMVSSGQKGEFAKDEEGGTCGSDQESISEDDPIISTPLVLTIDEEYLRKTCDMKKETAETICALLESEVSGFRTRKWANTKFHLKFFSKSPEELLKSNSKALTPYDRRVLDIVQKQAKHQSGQYNLDLKLASITEDQIIGALNRLQAGRHISFEGTRPGLLIDCPAEAHQHLKTKAEVLAGSIHQRLETIQKVRTKQAQCVIDTFSKADEMLSDMEQSNFLHTAVHGYFSCDTDGADKKLLELNEGCEEGSLNETRMEELRTAALALSGDTRYGPIAPQTARQVARIMHGIDSASFRAKEWCRNRYWGQFVEHEFQLTKRLAATVLREQHMSQRLGTKGR